MAAFKLLTILVTLGVAYSQSPAAPVLIWGNHHSIDKMTPNLGKITEESIMKPGSEDEKPHALIGILETLSLRDLFKKYGNEDVFSNVKNSITESKFKNYFAQARGLPKSFQDDRNQSLSGIQNMVATSDNKHVRVIKITPKGEDDVETLKMADNIMYKACMEHASLYKSYICVMTGSNGGQEGDHVRIARSLLQTTEEPDVSQNVYYLKDFALVYTKTTPHFAVTENGATTAYNLTKITAEPTKDDHIMYVRFQDKSVGTKTWRFGFNFSNTTSKWSLESIIYGDVTKTSTTLTPSIPISTSFGYSFHTPSKVVFKSETGDIKLTFNSLQIEFSSTLPTMKFNLADDTVYFFTIPILSGLFVTSLLVTIVLLGLSMIFDIKTMDLFDDPKGKTVTINASE